MGNSLCSCNHKQEQTTEVHMNNGGKPIESAKFGLKGKFQDEETEQDLDNIKSRARNNIDVKSINNKFNNSLSLSKIIMLQQNIKEFLKRIKNPNDRLQSKYTGMDQASPDHFTAEPDKKKTFSNNNNFEYMGDRVNGEKEGFGIQKWKDGAVYVGMFKANRANGTGVFKHSDGDEYKGEFVNDRACGYGMYKHSNGATYEGFWVDDCQNGIGEEKWSDNSEYKGNYSKGKKQGLGTYIWSDKSRYEGEWYENCLHGYGVYYFNDDRIYIGQWQYNSMHGYGEFKWKDGKRYVGYYVHDKKEGFGIYYWASPNRVYIGFWKGGKQDGVGKYINPKVVRYGLWKNGERERWFNSEKEAMESMTHGQEKFKTLFKYDLKDITNFLS